MGEVPLLGLAFLHPTHLWSEALTNYALRCEIIFPGRKKMKFLRKLQETIHSSFLMPFGR
jgi:hypothetical protein